MTVQQENDWQNFKKAISYKTKQTFLRLGKVNDNVKHLPTRAYLLPPFWPKW